MTYVIKGMIMPGGWHYEQPAQSGKEKIIASTYKELLQNVEHWRLENHFPLGNVQLDVDSYICGRFPRQCLKPQTQWAASPQAQKGQTFVDQITDWLIQLSRRKDINHLHKDLAYKRAETCSQCNYNQQYHNGCGACMQNITRLGTMARKNQSLSISPSLHGCKILKQDNRTAVWLDIYGEGMVNNQLPDYCWARKK